MEIITALVVAVLFGMAALYSAAVGIDSLVGADNFALGIYGVMYLMLAATLANGMLLCTLILIRSKAAESPPQELIDSIEGLRREFEWQRGQIEAHRNKKAQAGSRDPIAKA